MLLLYIHGFNSSPQSIKAVRLGEWLREHHPAIRYEVPRLSNYPADAMQQLETLVQPCAVGETVGLIGSSLGGYYAAYLAEKYGLRAVLINPSVRPFELLSRYLGENENFYTHERWVFEPHHADELLQFHVPVMSHPENILLLAQTGDQTLDYREATAKYHASPCIIEHGGDHGFAGFERYFDTVIQFLGLR